MTIKSILAAALIFACASAFAYRDAIAQTMSCSSVNGCYDGVAIPCSTGSGTCVNMTYSSGDNRTPGDPQPCTDGSTPQYYSATPPAGWQDCKAPTTTASKTYCPRTVLVCETVNFYSSKLDCTNNNPCSTNKIYACAWGNPPPPGGGPPVLTGTPCTN